MADVNPIEPGDVLPHVGLHKTGTTALQVALLTRGPTWQRTVSVIPTRTTVPSRPAPTGTGWQNNGAREVPRKHWDELRGRIRLDGRTVVSSGSMTLTRRLPAA